MALVHPPPGPLGSGSEWEPPALDMTLLSCRARHSALQLRRAVGPENHVRAARGFHPAGVFRSRQREIRRTPGQAGGQSPPAR